MNFTKFISFIFTLYISIPMLSCTALRIAFPIAVLHSCRLLAHPANVIVLASAPLYKIHLILCSTYIYQQTGRHWYNKWFALA